MTDNHASRTTMSKTEVSLNQRYANDRQRLTGSRPAAKASNSSSEDYKKIFSFKKVQRKLFIGGIKNKLTENDLTAYFGRFGPVKCLKVFRNSATGKRRGFGFIIFRSKKSFIAVKEQRFHTIKETIVECKSTVPKKNPLNAREMFSRSYIDNRLEQIKLYQPPSRLDYFAYKTNCIS